MDLYKDKINIITKIIKENPKPQNHTESINLFRKIYDVFNPEEWLNHHTLFNISNIIAKNRPDLICIGIRLNVQVNLYLRTLKKYGSTDLFNKLKYKIGSFGLTESRTGVLSGLIIDTVFSEYKNEFKINTPYGIHKNWISQVISADVVLIFAKNICDSTDIRIFAVPTNQNGIKIENIDFLDISKTLDIGKINLNNVLISKNNILFRTTVLKPLELLNGIFYGRYMIAEAVVASIIGLLDYCEHLKSQNKKLNLPNINNTMNRARMEMTSLSRLMTIHRDDLLKNNKIYIINSLKIKGVERSLYWFNEISIVLTTHILKYPLKYEHLILNKVAEGDTTILKLSLVKKLYQKNMFLFLKKSNSLSPYNLYKLWNNPKNYVIENIDSISKHVLHYHLSKL